MAKNQNLSLNPTTISGLCGKLLCCISYEDSLYEELSESSKSQENKPDESKDKDEEEIVKLEI